jgi:hypothetical protein
MRWRVWKRGKGAVIRPGRMCRPFRAGRLLVRYPGFRCASPWARLCRRFAAGWGAWALISRCGLHWWHASGSERRGVSDQPFLELLTWTGGEQKGGVFDHVGMVADLGPWPPLPSGRGSDSAGSRLYALGCGRGYTLTWGRARSVTVAALIRIEQVLPATRRRLEYGPYSPIE